MQQKVHVQTRATVYCNTKRFARMCLQAHLQLRRYPVMTQIGRIGKDRRVSVLIGVKEIPYPHIAEVVVIKSGFACLCQRRQIVFITRKATCIPKSATSGEKRASAYCRVKYRVWLGIKNIRRHGFRHPTGRPELAFLLQKAACAALGWWIAERQTR